MISTFECLGVGGTAMTETAASLATAAHASFGELVGSLAGQVTDLRGLCSLRAAPGGPAVDLKAICQRVFAAEAAMVELRTFIEQEEEAEARLEVRVAGHCEPRATSR